VFAYPKTAHAQSLYQAGLLPALGEPDGANRDREEPTDAADSTRDRIGYPWRASELDANTPSKDQNCHDHEGQ
jgi:hypothetical protein